jgi:4-azaleucine resistance transporter AzlC
MPIAMGYIPLAIVFGFLFVQAGGQWYMAILSSAMIYAGAAQFMMIPMLSQAMPIGSIALATLLINLRHVFYGLSLLERFPSQGWLRWYLMFTLTDETFSVISTLPAEASPRQLALLSALNQGWWVLGTAVGAIVGENFKVPLQGLDFVLVSLFAVLVAEQIRLRTTLFPILCAPIGFVLAQWIFPTQTMAMAIFFCVVLTLFWPKNENSRHAK